MKASVELLNLLNGVTNYAHRGDWERKVPENSYTAIWRAAEKGLGLEIDVHLTADGGLVVFHDFSLWRMCKVKGAVEDKTTAELTALRLKRTAETIPTFADVLRAVGGKTPILIELKCAEGKEIALCDALIDALKDYRGKYMFIGFDEKAAKYFKDKGYTIALSCFRPKTPSLEFIPDALLCNIIGVPRNKKKLAEYPPFISWTVNTRAEKRKSDKSCVATIFNTKYFNF